MVKLYGSVLSCHQHMHAWRSSGESSLVVHYIKGKRCQQKNSLRVGEVFLLLLLFISVFQVCFFGFYF